MKINQANTLEASWSKTPAEKNTCKGLNWCWKFHQDPFIPSKVIKLFLKDRQTERQIHTLRQVKFCNALFDTFDFTTFALLIQFVKDTNLRNYVKKLNLTEVNWITRYVIID